MDDVFGEVGSKYRISLADSTMMWIVHRAMDKAHDRAQRREGPVECLTAISMFYELAVILLEGCLKFLQEESDSTFETTDEEEVVGGLAEIRDRLVGRLKDAELAISEKDKELANRLEKELMLNKALENKEKELDSLRAEELDEDREGQFSGLKHSVDQQVWSIKQRLEPESKSLDRRRRNRSCDDFDIELMGIDIDILKETMDIAFGKMQSVVFSSEIEPAEQQWMWTIEKDTLSILIKGFIREIESEFHRQDKRASTHLCDSIKEMRFLHNELQSLCQSEGNQEGKIPLKLIGKSSSAMSSQQNSSDEDDDPKDGGGNLVAKMIKNHESIIKKKSKEVNREKRDITGERRSSYPWGDEDVVSSRRRMQDVIARIERLIDHTEFFQKTFSLLEYDEKVEGFCNQEKSISENVYEAFNGEVKLLKEEEEASLQTMIMKKTCATLLKSLISDSSKEKLKIVSKLNDQMESDKVDFQIKQEIQFMVFKNVVKDFCAEIRSLEDQNVGGELQEEIFKVSFVEICKGWKELIETHDTEKHFGEKMYKIALEESLKDMANPSRLIGQSKTMYIDGFGIFQCFKHSIQEDICRIVFRETFRGWKEEIEDHNFESLIREEVFLVVVFESVKEGSFQYKNTAAHQFDHCDIIEELTSGNKSHISQDVDEDEILTEKQDSELKCKMKISQNVLSEMRSTCSSMNCKVMKALDHMVMSKELVNELNAGLLVSSESDTKKASWLEEKALEGVKDHVAPSYSAFLPIMEFLQVFMEFKCRVEESLELNIIKLEGAINDIYPLAEVAATQRRRKRLYQKGFLNRCENLKKAEAEVDMLGNQVEVLLDLLQKICDVLQHHSPVLQQYFEVSDILKMIRKELVVGEVFASR